jgi:hypothetical protein
LINTLEQLCVDVPDCQLVTADVTSLYTQIPTQTGIAFVKRFLRERSSFPILLQDFIISVLRIVLENNYFTFNGETYHQTSGTAMGTPVAPAFANIFMFVLERSVIGRHGSSLLFYRRFLDDIFIISTKDNSRLLAALNSMHPRIKLEFSCSPDTASFLDLRIHKATRWAREGKFDIAVHQKLLNSYLYIPFHSFHPIRAKKAFIRTELMRYIRLGSDRSVYLAIRQTFWQRLRARGYPVKFLHACFAGISYASRATFLGPRTQKKSDDSERPTVFFTTEYDGLTSLLPLRRMLTRYLSPAVNITPLVGFRKAANLFNQLCANKVTPATRLE